MAGERPRDRDIHLAGTWPARDNQAMEHLPREHLMAGLGHIRDSPQDGGRVVLVASRPSVGQRELPVEAVLDQNAGLVGDNWLARGSKSMADGSADPERQVTVMNARAAELVAGGRERMPLAGDQLYVDLDLSLDNLPAGSLLAVGQAVLRVSQAPHLGCAKFVERFGGDAICQLSPRPPVAAARDERPCRGTWHRPARRPGHQGFHVRRRELAQKLSADSAPLSSRARLEPTPEQRGRAYEVWG